MRNLVIILLVLLCITASVRIDGVWPPASLRHQVEQTVQKVVEPARMIQALFSTPSSKDDRGFPGIARPAALFRSVVDGQLPQESAAAQCS
jgi:hypothetical protein